MLIIPSFPPPISQKTKNKVVFKRKWFLWLRTRGSGLASIKAVVLSHVSGVLGCRIFGRWAGGVWGRGCTCHMGYVYYLQLTFILFYVPFICISRFLCAAALLLNRVLTDCGVENNLTWTIILSRVIHGMLCNVKTPAVQKMVLSLFSLISALLLSAHPVQRWRERTFFFKKRNKKKFKSPTLSGRSFDW